LLVEHGTDATFLVNLETEAVHLRLARRAGRRQPSDDLFHAVRWPDVRFHVQCGTTSILHRDLNDLAQRLQEAIECAGYVHDPRISSQLLTRRLVMSVCVDSADAGAAIAIAATVLLSHLYEQGPEYRRVGIHHTDATPIS
jgi:hypothetical protein